MPDAKNSELSSNAGLGSDNQVEPPAVDVERQPLPDTAPETTSNLNTQPPARSGPSAQAQEKPTESDPRKNPTHHTGHIPPQVTLDRD